MRDAHFGDNSSASLRIVFAVALVVLVGSTACVGPKQGPLNVYEATRSTGSIGSDSSAAPEMTRPINLTKRAKRCSEVEEFKVGDSGMVKILYPPSVSAETIAMIAADYSSFWDQAREISGEGRYTEVHLYVVPFREMPESYTFRLVKYGPEWRSIHLAPLLLVGDVLRTDDYWSQLAFDVHEMMHHYLAVTLAPCGGSAPPVRWLEEGLCDLAAALILESQGDEGSLRAGTHETPLSPEAVTDASLLDWQQRELDPGRTPTTELVKESDRYALAYRMVRKMYEVDEGRSLRSLVARVRESSISNEGEMAELVTAVFSRDPRAFLREARRDLDVSDTDAVLATESSSR